MKNLAVWGSDACSETEGVRAVPLLPLPSDFYHLPIWLISVQPESDLCPAVSSCEPLTMLCHAWIFEKFYFKNIFFSYLIALKQEYDCCAL
jgi:hypothetical protein